jgi:hypothetical protein
MGLCYLRDGSAVFQHTSKHFERFVHICSNISGIDGYNNPPASVDNTGYWPVSDRLVSRLRARFNGQRVFKRLDLEDISGIQIIPHGDGKSTEQQLYEPEYLILDNCSKDRSSRGGF